MADSTLDFRDFDFAGATKDIVRGLLVKPILHTYLHDASFPAFDLHFDKQEMERAPDGFLHPSTHPLVRDRILYQYLAEPGTIPVEKKKYMSTLAVMFGKVWHEFVQVCLTDSGVMPPEMQVCEMCPPKAKCHEAGVLDTELGERGHMDGLLDFTGYANVPDLKTKPVLEFKTSNDNFGRLSKIPDLELDLFIEKWPVYYAQVQRYMRMAKRHWTIVLMAETVYPFEMREFHIPIDHAFNHEIDTKYRRVRQAVADQRRPSCCGATTKCVLSNYCKANR